MDRNEAIDIIRKSLKARSGKQWSVKGNRGTAWGWIDIDAPPKRRTWKFVYTDTPNPPCDGAVYSGSAESPEQDAYIKFAISRGMYVRYTWEVEDPNCEFGHMSPSDRKELAKLLNLESVHHQGVSIPSGSHYREEYVARAKGEIPTQYGERYWD